MVIKVCTSIGGGAGGGGSGRAGSGEKDNVIDMNKKLFGDNASIPEEKRKDLYVSFGALDVNKQGIAQSLSKYPQNQINDYLAKNPAIIINENLPNFTGTEKQIEFAKSLANNAVAKQIEPIAKNMNSQTYIDKFLSAAEKASGKKPKNVSEAVLMGLKANKNGAFARIMNMTSAKEVIDAFK